MIISLIGTIINVSYYCLAILILAIFATKIYVLCVKGICKCTARLDGKVVLVTGGNTGIGYYTAKRLAAHGARVVIASRNLEKSQAAARTIIKETGNANVEAKALNLGSLSRVKQFSEDFNRSYDRLDILINNAGYNQLEQEYTADGIELVMQVNHVGPAYLTHLLLDKLKASKPARIVFVSSGLYSVHMFDPTDLAGRKPRNLWVRYGNAKLCNILCAMHLAKVLPEGVTANALHPGTTASEIWERVPWETPRKLLYMLLEFACRTVEECAQTTIHAALAPSLAGATGQYLEECEVATATLKRIPAQPERLAQRVWDDTIRLAEDIVQRKKEA